MAIPRDIVNSEPALSKWAILTCYRGSISHGMYVPSSDPLGIDDKDAMVICVPPIDYYFGLNRFGSRGTKEIKRGEWDIVVYEVKKFISLLAKGNPNVLAVLWLSPNYYLSMTDSGRLIIDNRQLFVGKHVYRAFTGYAYAQLKRMTHFAFDGYMGQKRKQLVERFGYDVKNGAHLIRLLRMGIEFLTDGQLYVERHDAPQLLEIKRGEWTLEQVKAEADRLFATAEQAYVNSKLPPGPDMDKINDLCVEVIRSRFGAQFSR